MRRASHDSGAIVTEYVGVLVFVSALVAAVTAAMTTSVPMALADAVGTSVRHLSGTEPAQPDEPGPAVARWTDDIDPLAAPLWDPDATMAALDGPSATTLLEGLPARDRDQLLQAARGRADDDTAPVAVRTGANQLLMAYEVGRLTAVANRDGAELAVWDEYLELRTDRQLGIHGDPDESRASLERLSVLASRIDTAPDGSLLAALAKHADWVHSGGAGEPPTQAELDALLRRIDEAGVAEQRRDRFQRWLAEDRQLLWFDPHGDGRAAEVVSGDLQHAEHVAVLVPGTGSDIDNFDRSTRQYARNLAETIDDLDPTAATSVIACLCYDAPDTLPQARLRRYAQDGADELATVTDMIRGYAADSAQLTMLGHSYGATALGHGITDAGLTSDETVSLGGPGFGRHVRSVADLPDNAGRVWGVRHDKDPIALARPIHGRNPDRETFGAHRFDLGDSGVERRWVPYQLEFHSIYLVDELSRRNLALITLGRGEETEGYREGRE